MINIYLPHERKIASTDHRHIDANMKELVFPTLTFLLFHSGFFLVLFLIPILFFIFFLFREG